MTGTHRITTDFKCVAVADAPQIYQGQGMHTHTARATLHQSWQMIISCNCATKNCVVRSNTYQKLNSTRRSVSGQGERNQQKNYPETQDEMNRSGIEFLISKPLYWDTMPLLICMHGSFICFEFVRNNERKIITPNLNLNPFCCFYVSGWGMFVDIWNLVLIEKSFEEN